VTRYPDLGVQKASQLANNATDPAGESSGSVPTTAQDASGQAQKDRRVDLTRLEVENQFTLSARHNVLSGPFVLILGVGVESFRNRPGNDDMALGAAFPAYYRDHVSGAQVSLTMADSVLARFA
jgi:hypothetical protein